MNHLDKLLLEKFAGSSGLKATRPLESDIEAGRVHFKKVEKKIWALEREVDKLAKVITKEALTYPISKQQILASRIKKAKDSFLKIAKNDYLGKIDKSTDPWILEFKDNIKEELIPIQEKLQKIDNEILWPINRAIEAAKGEGINLKVALDPENEQLREELIEASEDKGILRKCLEFLAWLYNNDPEVEKRWDPVFNEANGAIENTLAVMGYTAGTRGGRTRAAFQILAVIDVIGTSRAWRKISASKTVARAASSAISKGKAGAELSNKLKDGFIEAYKQQNRIKDISKLPAEELAKIASAADDFAIAATKNLGKEAAGELTEAGVQKAIMLGLKEVGTATGVKVGAGLGARVVGKFLGPLGLVLEMFFAAYEICGAFGRGKEARGSSWYRFDKHVNWSECYKGFKDGFDHAGETFKSREAKRQKFLNNKKKSNDANLTMPFDEWNFWPVDMQCKWCMGGSEKYNVPKGNKPFTKTASGVKMEAAGPSCYDVLSKSCGPAGAKAAKQLEREDLESDLKVLESNVTERARTGGSWGWNWSQNDVVLAKKHGSFPFPAFYPKTVRYSSQRNSAKDDIVYIDFVPFNKKTKYIDEMERLLKDCISNGEAVKYKGGIVGRFYWDRYSDDKLLGSRNVTLAFKLDGEKDYYLEDKYKDIYQPFIRAIFKNWQGRGLCYVMNSIQDFFFEKSNSAMFSSRGNSYTEPLPADIGENLNNKKLINTKEPGVSKKMNYENDLEKYITNIINEEIDKALLLVEFINPGAIASAVGTTVAKAGLGKKAKQVLDAAITAGLDSASDLKRLATKYGTSFEKMPASEANVQMLRELATSLDAEKGGLKGVQSTNWRQGAGESAKNLRLMADQMEAQLKKSGELNVLRRNTARQLNKNRRAARDAGRAADAAGETANTARVVANVAGEMAADALNSVADLRRYVEELRVNINALERQGLANAEEIVRLTEIVAVQARAIERVPTPSGTVYNVTVEAGGQAGDIILGNIGDVHQAGKVIQNSVGERVVEAARRGATVGDEVVEGVEEVGRFRGVWQWTKGKIKWIVFAGAAGGAAYLYGTSIFKCAAPGGRGIEWVGPLPVCKDAKGKKGGKKADVPTDPKGRPITLERCVDGKCGAATKRAIKAFQGKSGIKNPTGIVDLTTAQLMIAAYRTTFSEDSPDLGRVPMANCKGRAGDLISAEVRSNADVMNALGTVEMMQTTLFKKGFQKEICSFGRVPGGGGGGGGRRKPKNREKEPIKKPTPPAKAVSDPNVEIVEKMAKYGKECAAKKLKPRPLLKLTIDRAERETWKSQIGQVASDLEQVERSALSEFERLNFEDAKKQFAGLDGDEGYKIKRFWLYSDGGKEEIGDMRWQDIRAGYISGGESRAAAIKAVEDTIGKPGNPKPGVEADFPGTDFSREDELDDYEDEINALVGTLRSNQKAMSDMRAAKEGGFSGRLTSRLYSITAELIDPLLNEPIEGAKVGPTPIYTDRLQKEFNMPEGANSAQVDSYMFYAMMTDSDIGLQSSSKGFLNAKNFRKHADNMNARYFFGQTVYVPRDFRLSQLRLHPESIGIAGKYLIDDNRNISRRFAQDPCGQPIPRADNRDRSKAAGAENEKVASPKEPPAGEGSPGDAGGAEG